jgi:membrane-associated PAP2 superfamily phosphatase
MPRTVPPPPQAVNAPPRWRGVGRDMLAIWGTFGGLALLGYLSGLEAWLAHAVYQPDISQFWGSLAWWLRQWGAAVPGYIAVAALLALFWPKLWQSRPWLYQACAVLAFTSLLGAGLVNQVIVQELADRHRPRETLLIGQAPQNLPAELSGNSMPSGHAGIAFCLAAPFFVWRRTRPNLAKMVLVAGLGVGAVVGAGRMVLGAHYLSDILVAAAIALSFAAIFTPLLVKVRRVPYRLLLGGFALAGAAVVLGNHFKLTLTAQLPQPLPRLELPCAAAAVPAPAGTPAGLLTLQLAGYGAPVSGLKLATTSTTVRLARGLGVFHSLSCTGTLTVEKVE